MIGETGIKQNLCNDTQVHTQTNRYITYIHTHIYTDTLKYIQMKRWKVYREVVGKDRGRR